MEFQDKSSVWGAQIKQKQQQQQHSKQQQHNKQQQQQADQPYTTLMPEHLQQPVVGGRGTHRREWRGERRAEQWRFLTFSVELARIPVNRERAPSRRNLFQDTLRSVMDLLPAYQPITQSR